MLFRSIVFAENATSILKSSTIVEIDAAAGTVSNRTRTERGGQKKDNSPVACSRA